MSPLSRVQTGQMTTPFDYDRNPERFRLAARVTRQHLRTARSLHDHLAEALVGVQARRILDIGCGEGALGVALPQPLRSRLVRLDASRTMLRANPPPVVQADATALPFLADVFDAAVAVNVLDHLAEPTVAIGTPEHRPPRVLERHNTWRLALRSTLTPNHCPRTAVRQGASWTAAYHRQLTVVAVARPRA